MVKEILTLAKENYGEAVKKHGKRKVDRVLADEKAKNNEAIEPAQTLQTEEQPQDTLPSLEEESSQEDPNEELYPYWRLTEPEYLRVEGLKRLLIGEVAYEHLLKVVDLLIGEKNLTLIKRQIATFTKDGLTYSDIARSLYYIYLKEGLNYSSKYGIGVVPTYLSNATKLFEAERKNYMRLWHQPYVIETREDTRPIKINTSEIINRRKEAPKGLNLIDMSKIGVNK